MADLSSSIRTPARRSFLRGLASAPAVPIVGAGAALAGSSSALPAQEADQHLDDLFASFAASFKAAEAASVEAERVEDALAYPEPLPAMFVRDGDDELGLSDFAFAGQVPIDRIYRNCWGVRHAARMIDHYEPGHPNHAAAVRAAEILNALDAYDDARKRVRSASGIEALQVAERRSWDVNCMDRQALAAAQASTLRGILFKAHTIATLERGPDGLQEWATEARAEGPATSNIMAASIVLDLIRINGLEGSHDA